MSEPIKGYKVFNPDWTCRDFQYEVGKTFEDDVTPGIATPGIATPGIATPGIATPGIGTFLLLILVVL